MKMVFTPAALVEFVCETAMQKAFRKDLKEGLAGLMHTLILYMQLTDDQVCVGLRGIEGVRLARPCECKSHLARIVGRWTRVRYLYFGVMCITLPATVGDVERRCERVHCGR